MLAKYLHDAASTKRTHTQRRSHIFRKANGRRSACGRLRNADAAAGGDVNATPTMLALNSEVDAIEIENKTS